jgi:hypothetical protein
MQGQIYDVYMKFSQSISKMWPQKADLSSTLYSYNERQMRIFCLKFVGATLNLLKRHCTKHCSDNNSQWITRRCSSFSMCSNRKKNDQKVKTKLLRSKLVEL